jgi:hypothetical protein
MRAQSASRAPGTLWLALGLFGLSTAAVLGAYDRDVFSNDGAEYLSVARSLRSGRGLVTSILSAILYRVVPDAMLTSG